MGGKLCADTDYFIKCLGKEWLYGVYGIEWWEFLGIFNKS